MRQSVEGVAIVRLLFRPSLPGYFPSCVLNFGRVAVETIQVDEDRDSRIESFAE